MKVPVPGLAALALGTSLVACGGGGDGPATGQIDLKLTDVPVDGAEAVILVFTGVELPPAGDYNWMRLKVVAEKNLQNSISSPADREPNYALRPVLRLVDDVERAPMANID